jgi:UDP-N-acetylmuramoylalanine--D-glutamate ligase
MTISDLNDKSVCILGYGREGRATYLALQQYAPKARITIADTSSTLASLPNVPFITGPDYLARLGDFDVIVKTPGIPWRPKADILSRLTSATELFLSSLGPGVKTIGITGTKGKSTTASLIYQVLHAAGRQVILAGNIGEPMLGHLKDAASGTIFVLELSSYQLETLKVSPETAVITSFFPDHLDYHGSMQEYFEAKSHIARYQHAGDVVFFNGTSSDCQKLASLSPGEQIPFSPEDFPGHPAPIFDSPAGRSNLAAAFMVATRYGVPKADAVKTLETAQALPHRLQTLGTHHQIVWIDDSAATTPESTVTALDATKGHIDTILVGGLDRGYDFTELGHRLANSSVTNIVMFPDTGARIRESIEAAGPVIPKTYYDAASMEEAVAFAIKSTKPGHICLLSSGSPSYNMFTNYFERGEAFQSAILRARG